MKIDNQIKYLIFSCTLLIVSCAVFVLVFEQVKKNKVTADKIEENWQRESTLRYELTSLDRLLKSVDSEVKVLGPHFVKGDDIVPFLDTLEKSAYLAGASAEVLSVDSLDDSSGLLIGIKAIGNFEALYKYITLLENLRYELEFYSISLARTNGINGSKPEWAVILKVKLLSYIK